jgi:hypothetical protein
LKINATMLRVRLAMRSAKERLATAVRAGWNATDNNDRLIFPGLLFIGVGVYRLNPAYALIVVGALLVLMGRPLRNWFF